MLSKLIDPGYAPKWLMNPAWWAVTNFLVSLFGIIFLNWHLQPLVYLFWIEVILSLASALIRVLGAMSGQAFFDTLFSKLFVLLTGGALSIAFILLTVTFTINAFTEGFDGSGFEHIVWQMLILVLNYAAALLLHYFLNGKFKTATPIGELIPTFVRLLFLLCLLMAITQFLLPKFPQLNAARWTGVAILVIKFTADWLFSSRQFAAIEREISTTQYD